MNSGPGLAGRTVTARGGGGGPMLIPIEISAANKDPYVSSVAIVSTVALRKQFLIFAILLCGSCKATTLLNQK